jgi:hypothetical protein
MVNARKGVGYMVEAARKVLDFERVYAGIIAIGIAAPARWLRPDGALSVPLEAAGPAGVGTAGRGYREGSS